MSQIFERINLVLAQIGLLLCHGTALDATIVDAPSGTKNKNKERRPGMASGKRARTTRFGMKAHPGVDMDSGIVHLLTFTASNAADVGEIRKLIRSAEAFAVGDKGCISAEIKAECAEADIDYAVCQRAKPNGTEAEKAARLAANALISSVRAIAEYLFRIVKWLWRLDRTRFLVLEKNASWLTFAFTLANLHQVRRQILKKPLVIAAPADE